MIHNNNTSLLQRCKQHLLTPVSIAPLVTFRIVFGGMMLFSTIRFLCLGWIEDHYLQPIFHFKYFGFEWLEVLPAFWMYAVHYLMIVAALGFMLGWYYRISAILLFLTFTYTELIDLTYYLNHYYFVSIVCLLMVFLPANSYFSLDVIRKPSLYSDTIARWPITVIRLQLAIIYTFAGLAKINYDWLILALPLKIWLPANDQWPLIGFVFKWKVLPYIFSWAGMIYDCTIVLLLSIRKTRLLAYISVVFFHVITGLMFQIGVFPLVMMGATLIFFSEAWHLKLLNGIRSFLSKITPVKWWKSQQVTSKQGIFAPGKIVTVLFIIHFIFQLLFPWRYLLYPGNLFWTEEGYRFSWRVMLMEKAGTATFYVKDAVTGKEGAVINSEFLNPHQEKQMAMQPDMILQFAHFLAKHYESEGMKLPAVRAEVYVTLNARPSELLIDPKANLAEIKDSFSPKKWILPYAN
jgi:hypothetical protein